MMPREKRKNNRKKNNEKQTNTESGEMKGLHMEIKK